MLKKLNKGSVDLISQRTIDLIQLVPMISNFFVAEHFIYSLKKVFNTNIITIILLKNN